MPPAIRRIANAVRQVVRKEIPSAFEVAYPGWKAIGFRDPQAGYFCGLFPLESFVQLVFERGAELADPDGLFAQRPNLRQVRMVEVRTMAQARAPALRRLLVRAVVHGSTR
jgi:hypothetical protein